MASKHPSSLAFEKRPNEVQPRQPFGYYTQRPAPSSDVRPGRIVYQKVSMEYATNATTQARIKQGIFGLSPNGPFTVSSLYPPPTPPSNSKGVSFLDRLFTMPVLSQLGVSLRRGTQAPTPPSKTPTLLSWINASSSAIDKDAVLEAVSQTTTKFVAASKPGTHSSFGLGHVAQMHRKGSRPCVVLWTHKPRMKEAIVVPICSLDGVHIDDPNCRWKDDAMVRQMCFPVPDTQSHEAENRRSAGTINQEYAAIPYWKWRMAPVKPHQEPQYVFLGTPIRCSMEEMDGLAWECHDLDDPLLEWCRATCVDFMQPQELYKLRLDEEWDRLKNTTNNHPDLSSPMIPNVRGFMSTLRSPMSSRTGTWQMTSRRASIRG